MKTTYLILLLVFSLQMNVFSQAYTLWSTGNALDTITHPKPCTLLMGGATEDDQAMKRFLQYADHGDIVVIRTSGADGYNAYLYSQLGVQVNSVQTLLVPTIAAANDSFVVQTVRNAEALWIAGGDQWTYVSNWKNTALNTAINHLVNVRKVPIGGTSAGMAIMGEYYNSAQGGSAVSATVLANPYDATVTIGNSDFINNSLMSNIITDTHFDNPDRRGRLMTFIARTWKDKGAKINAIASEEYTSVFIDSNKKATVFAGGTAVNDHAYFIQIDCAGINTIENCTSGSPLNWKQDSTVVKVYDILSDSSGTQYFDLRNFSANPIYPNQGGVWQDWWVSNGTFNSKAGTAINCGPSTIKGISQETLNLQIIPNPFQSSFQIELDLQSSEALRYSITDIQGKSILEPAPFKVYPAGYSVQQIDLSESLPNGMYILKMLNRDGKQSIYKLIKQ